MSNVLGAQLPDALLLRLDIARATQQADRAIVICSIDDEGRPHPAMLSSLEVVAKDARELRLTIHHASRSARNLVTNGRVTLIVADEDGVFYIKGDAWPLSTAMVAAPDQAMFRVSVESVLEDNPTRYENASITSGIRVARGAFDLARANAVLTELITEP